MKEKFEIKYFYKKLLRLKLLKMNMRIFHSKSSQNEGHKRLKKEKKKKKRLIKLNNQY